MYPDDLSADDISHKQSPKMREILEKLENNNPNFTKITQEDWSDTKYNDEDILLFANALSIFSQLIFTYSLTKTVPKTKSIIYIKLFVA